MFAKAVQNFVWDGISAAAPAAPKLAPQEVEDKDQHWETNITVIGVGGAGGRAIEHMIREGVHGAQFIVMDTDMRALKRSTVKHRIQLEHNALPADVAPQAGRHAAMQSRERIAASLTGAYMVFIVAGLGGATGSSAAPIVAEVAREMGILTVAVVTWPFRFEGRRPKAAQTCVMQLEKQVDALILIRNDQLMQVAGDDVLMCDAFTGANTALHQTVCGISEIFTLSPQIIGCDFEDVRSVLSDHNGRIGMMGAAQAAGIDRARRAAQEAIASPLLAEIDLAHAHGVLVSIAAGPGVKMKEINEAISTVREAISERAQFIFGVVHDERMGEHFRVTVVATGYASQTNYWGQSL